MNEKRKGEQGKKKISAKEDIQVWKDHKDIKSNCRLKPKLKFLSVARETKN